MKKLSLFMFVLAALAGQLASAQEIAGRVLVVAGDMTIIRGSQRIAAKVGTEVRAGDTLQVGAQSNAQVLLTDQSVFSLRPETTLRLSEYAFEGKSPETQRAFFDLVKGGLRTLSGLIGKAKADNYGVTTKTATIGIRGTHYSLVVCNDSCRGSSGALAPNGTYGTVTDGRIAVTNNTGETVFGANQYFSVASQNSKPEQLIAPPGFLRDSLEGRAKAKKTGTEKTETQATSSPSGDANITSTTSSTTAPVTLTESISPVQTATQTQGAGAVITPTATGTVFFRATGATVPSLTCNHPPCGNITIVSITLGVNLALQRVAASVNFLGDSGKAFNLGSPASSGTDGIPLTISNGQLVFSKTFNRADYPQNQGAFRCQDCGIGNSVGFLETMTISGVISGTTAKLLLAGTDATGGGSFAVDLTQVTPPNNAVAAAVIPIQSGGAVATSSNYWGVSVDSAGKLLAIGPGTGANKGDVGSMTNTQNGSAPTAGNLVWGHWFGLGGTLTDFNYNTYATASGTVVPWITGTAPNTLPASLGVLTYSPVGGFVNNGSSGVLNSGSLSADFVNRVLTISLNATNTSFNNTYQMNGSTGISAITPRFGAGFTSVTCTGANCAGTPTGSYNGFFAGANAEGAGVAFTAGYGTGNGVNGVAAFKR
jgi:hypothetical protein